MATRPGQAFEVVISKTGACLCVSLVYRSSILLDSRHTPGCDRLQSPLISRNRFVAFNKPVNFLHSFGLPRNGWPFFRRIFRIRIFVLRHTLDIWNLPGTPGALVLRFWLEAPR